MKLNIVYPRKGTQGTREISWKEEERLHGRAIGNEFDGGLISEEFSGCLMRITGGNNYQGMPMVASVVGDDQKARVLLSKGDTGYRCRGRGVRKKKSVCGSKISGHTQVLNVSIIDIPEDKEIPGFTDSEKPRSHLPKRASRLRRMFNIPDDEKDIAGYIRRIWKERNPDAEPPKIKRITGLVTEEEKIKRQKKREARRIRKEKHLREKDEYESKYKTKVA